MVNYTITTEQADLLSLQRKNTFDKRNIAMALSHSTAVTGLSTRTSQDIVAQQKKARTRRQEHALTNWSKDDAFSVSDLEAKQHTLHTSPSVAAHAVSHLTTGLLIK